MSNLEVLKGQVLGDQVAELVTDLGSPERYFTALRSEGLIDQYDCEKIRSEVTTRDKVVEFVDLLRGRQGRDGRPAFDVLVEVLEREKIHASVARGLQRALARAVEEAELGHSYPTSSGLDLDALKKKVLRDQEGVLVTDLGSPERYFTALRSEGLLDQYDCERIRSEVTSKEKIEKFVDFLSEGRQGRDGRATFDVLVEVLERGKVHASVARGLQKELARAKKEELEYLEITRLSYPEASNDEFLAHSVDGMEVACRGACDRGTHTPQLKLHENHLKITEIEPRETKQIHGPDMDYYPMANPRHGVALIINNKEFDRHLERKGSDRDESNLIESWLYLGYRVEVKRNCSSREMMRLFENVDEFLKTSNDAAVDKVSNDSFICCILSHGDKDNVFGSDSRAIKTEDIERKIGRSEMLKRKPKLFFVQACRGPNPGAEIHSDEGRYSKRSDINFCYATAPGDRAYRNTLTGSWFITELCKILCEYAPCCTLHQMENKLNAVLPANAQYTYRPAVGLKSGPVQEVTQQPSSAGSMTKDVHFFDSKTPFSSED